MRQQREAEIVVCCAHSLLTDLKSCSLKRDLEWGRRIHAKAAETGNDSNAHVVTALVRMYGKCGSMVDARCAFDGIRLPDVVSWNTLLLGYAENGEGAAALELFCQMKARGYLPNSLTHVAALKACISMASKGLGLEHGRGIHSEIGGGVSSHYVHSALIDMYGKCGNMVDARRVFDSVQKPDVLSWNALLLGYVENGEGLTALEQFSQMKARGCAPDPVTYVACLKACAANGRECLERGREIHSEIGCHTNHYVESALIDMYAKCGSIPDARRVFDGIRVPDVVSWNALLMGYAENGEGTCALDLFSRMKARGCAPNSVTYIAALKACTCLAVNGDESGKRDCLERGREIHLEIGRHMNPYVRSTLIDMYAKCGVMDQARLVFEGARNPVVVSWNALLMGYVENGEGRVALGLLSRMKSRGCVPDRVTYVAALKACTSLAASGGDSGRQECLERGRGIHLEIGCSLDLYLQSALIDMYASCGSMVEARRVFDSIQNPDVVTWSALILGYAENGHGHDALELFSRMEAQGCLPNSITYIAAVKACSSIGALAHGRKFHSEIRQFTPHVVTCLVDFYVKCGSIGEAREVFDLHPRARDVSTWNALLAGYGSFGDTASVFDLFEEMQDKGFRPDGVTVLCVLLCCSHAGLVEKAREYFKAMPVKYGVTPGVKHYTCMVDALGRANQLDEAIALVRRMPCSPAAITWKALLGACCKWKNVEIGRVAFQSLVVLDSKDSSAYLLMAQIYGGHGMWEEQERVLKRSPAAMIPNSPNSRDSPEVEDKLKHLAKA